MSSLFDRLSALPEAAALAVGNFDGVHLGHQAILNAMLAFAQATSRSPWILSFEGAPTTARPTEQPARIYDTALQTQTLLATGASLIRQPFTPDFSSLSAIDFLAQLKGAAIFCGEDWRFGQCAQGNVAFLKERQYPVQVIPYVLSSGERISSTRIRAALMAGEMAQAGAMLGRTWEFTGTVCHGRGLAGKTFGVPTLNLPYHGRAGERLVPLAHGVYHGYASVQWGNEPPQHFKALMNFGTAPSVKGLDEPLFEVHLLEATGDFYGCEVTLSIAKNRVRAERKFDSFEALHEQILADLTYCREQMQ